MPDVPAKIRVAQTIGITYAAFVAGGTFCISYLHVPSLTLAPYPLIIRQWKRSFDTGKMIHTGLGLLSSLAYGYLAYQMQGTLNQPKAEIYGVCIVSNLIVFPWNIFVTMPTNEKLSRKYDDAQAMGSDEAATEVGLSNGETAKGLIERWSTFNLMGGLTPLVGAVLGLWVTLT